MKFAVVDVQGFQVPEFQAKELAIYDGKHMKSYLFKPTTPFHTLSDDCKKQVLFLHRNHHGLFYNYGVTDYSDLYTIISNDLRDVDQIYVKGHIKKSFLDEIYSQSSNKPHVVNLESSINAPKLSKDVTTCSNHDLEVCNCSIRNAYILYDYIYDFLPK